MDVLLEDVLPRDELQRNVLLEDVLLTDVLLEHVLLEDVILKVFSPGNGISGPIFRFGLVRIKKQRQLRQIYSLRTKKQL